MAMSKLSILKRVGFVSGGLIVVVLLLTILSCSNDSPTDSNGPGFTPYANLLDGVQFTPSSGPPGTTVSIIGLDSLPADSGFTLYIGDQPAPLFSSAGSMQTAIPIYMDTTVSWWPVTPSGLQTVTLRFNDIPVDSVPSAIQVDSLIPAPKAMDSAMVKLSAGATALKQIALSIGAEDTLLLATCDAMDELLYTGDYSLTALLNGTSPVAGYDSSSTAIFSSLMVSSGMLDVISRWSDTLVTASQVASRIPSKQSNAVFLTDEQLASRMQLHDYLESLGSQVIGQTAVDWQTLSMLMGVVSLTVPAVGVYEFIVSWVIGELDFIMNKIAIAMLPSDVTRLDLDFYNHQIHVGDTTEAIVRISAKNNPPNITPADIIGQVLAGLTLTKWIQDRLGPVIASTLIDLIKDIVNWALGIITNIMNANYNHPTSLDVALPAATWDSVWVHNPGLVDLMSPDLSKIGYIDGSFNGQAKDSIGPVGLQMRTQPSGPSMYIGPIMSSLGYAGGAFGNDLTTSNIDTVTVVSELALEISFANTITVEGANLLGIKAGYLDRNGNPHWAPDIDISLSVTDGTADSTSGITDADGYFSSMIAIDSTADSVIVHVFAYGEYDAQTDTVVMAYIESAGQIAFVCNKGGTPGLWSINDDGTNLRLLASLGHLIDNPGGIKLLSTSPDGEYIALWGNGLNDPNAYPYFYSSQLWVGPTSGGGVLRKVGYGLKEMLLGGGYFFDSQVWFQSRFHTLLYTAYEKQRFPEPSVLFEENAATGYRIGLGPTPYNPNSPNPNLPLNVVVSKPVISYDGSQIAFVSGSEGSENISICNSDGTNQHILIGGLDYSVKSLFWTKDNNHLVAVMNVYASSVMLYSVSGGTGTEIITNNGAIYSPEFFHNRNAFAFYGMTAAPNNIPEGSLRFYSFEDNAIHIVMSSVSTWDIALSPNDRSIAYANAELGGDVFTVNMETGELTQLTFENIGARKIVWYATKP